MQPATLPTAFEWPDAQPTCSEEYVAPVILEWLGKGGAGRVLDLGCGNGSLTVRIARQGFDTVGIDASASGIRIAGEHMSSAMFIQQRIEDPLPPELSGCFDAVVAAEVIEHLLVPRALCARAREALGPHGRLILTTPYHGYWKNLALALTGRLDRHWQPWVDGGHVKFFSRATLTKVLQQEGFVVTRFVRVGRVPAFAKSMIVEARSVQ